MSCKRTYSVSLRFFADELEPDEITTLLGLEPTTSYRQGDIRRTRSGRALGVWRNGGWVYNEKLKLKPDDDKSLGDALDGFMRKLSGVKRKIGSISRRPDMSLADIYVAELGDSNLQFPGMVLSLATLEMLSEMGLEFWCEFYGWKHAKDECK